MKKRGKEKGIHIHLTNRWLYTFIAIGILAVIGIGVYALTPGVAPNPGHLISDVAPPSGCVSGQILQYNNGNWACVNLPTSSNPAPVSTGLYGSCTIYNGQCWTTTYAPAICEGNWCGCAAGYDSVMTGYPGSTSGWKIYSCIKN